MCVMPFVTKTRLRARNGGGRGTFSSRAESVLVVPFLCSAHRGRTHPKGNRPLERGRGPLRIRRGLEAGGARSAESGGSRAPAFGPAQVRSSGDQPGVVSRLQGQRPGCRCARRPRLCCRPWAYSNCVCCAGIRSVFPWLFRFLQGLYHTLRRPMACLGCHVIEI